MTDRMNRLLLHCGAVILSVGLCAASVPPFSIAPLGLLGLAPLAVVSARAAPGYALLLGLGFGTALNLWAFHWTVPAMIRSGSLVPPLALTLLLLLAIAHALRFAVLTVLYAWATGRGLRPWLALPAATVSAELGVPMLFPWHVGFLVGARLEWIQLAEIGGLLVVSMWVAAANGLFAQAWLRRALGWEFARPIVAAFVLVLGITAAGRTLMRHAQSRNGRAPASRVGIVQLPNEVGVLGVPSPLSNYLDETAKLLAVEPNLALVVWPEASISVPVRASELALLERELHHPSFFAGARRAAVVGCHR